MNNKALPLVRVNVIKQYLIPALIHVNCQFKIKFYSKHIKSLTKVIKEQLINKEDELCIQLNIHSSIFNILQISFFNIYIFVLNKLEKKSGTFFKINI